MPISLKEAGASPPSFSAGQVTAAVTAAASHIGWVYHSARERNCNSVTCFLQMKESRHDQTEALHVLPVPEGSPNTDVSLSFSSHSPSLIPKNQVGNGV